MSPTTERRMRVAIACAAMLFVVSVAASARADVDAHRTGISPWGRFGWTSYFGDRIAGALPQDVFPGGLSFEVGLGFIVLRGFSLTLAWERVMTNAGAASPYADFATYGGYGDRWTGGLRAVLPSDGVVAFVYVAGLGLSQFRQYARDTAGNEADANFRGFTAHNDLGFTLRPTPFMAFDITGRFTVANLNGHSGSVVAGGVTTETSSDNSMWFVGLSPGLRAAMELGFE